jgi:type III secretion protein J
MGRGVLLLLLLLAMIASCTSKTTIANSIPERDANEIVVLLNSKGIPAEKIPSPAAAVGGATTEKMWDIVVPANQITEALAILNQAGLPRVKGTSLLDLFGTQSWVPSDLQDKIRYQEGLSEQLATTIRKMDGIIDANVQITFSPGEEGTAKKASVYVKHRGILDNPNSLAISKIKRLVSSAIPGLHPEDVTVITDRAVTADINFPTPQQQLVEEKGLVSIWSIPIAKESVTRFRLIFYIFIILLFLLAVAVAWLLWKFFPIIRDRGGFSSLFHYEPYETTKPSVEEEEKEKEE